MSEDVGIERRVRVAMCCYYLDPEKIAAKAKRTFWREKNMRFYVYSTNATHVAGGDGETNFESVENRYNDFSAYMRACESFVKEGCEAGRKTVYVFLNDTFLMRHPARVMLKLLRGKLNVVTEADVPVLCGMAHPYRALLQTSPFAPGLDRYISTFLFATNWAGVGLLHSTLSSPETAAMLRSASSFEGGGIPHKFAAFLRLHLSAGRSVFSWSGERSGGGNDRKSACVLLEHLVSAKFFESGFVLPINSSTFLNGVVLFQSLLRRAASKGVGPGGR